MILPRRSAAWLIALSALGKSSAISPPLCVTCWLLKQPGLVEGRGWGVIRPSHWTWGEMAAWCNARGAEEGEARVCRWGRARRTEGRSPRPEASKRLSAASLSI